EGAGPQRPAGRQRQVVAVGVRDEGGPVVGVDYLLVGHAVAVEPVSGLQVDLVALLKLRKVDPVDVVRGDPHGARVAGPARLRVVARSRVEAAAVHTFADGGEVVQPRDPDGEVDAVDRALQAAVNRLG